MKRFGFFLFSFLTIGFSHAQSPKTENIILVTLDGFRWQEVFTGADPLLVGNKKFVSDSVGLTRKYWASTAEVRRQTLMPFVWGTIARQGQLYGNRQKGSKVNVTNTMWFSYPGYNEILTGAADDSHVTSNDKINNPNINILEVLNKDARYKNKVAAFSSWDCFPFIINTERSGVPVSAGIVKATANPTEREQFINELMYEVPNPLGDVRLDAFTFYYGFEQLKKSRLKALYLSFDETDDFAHGGKYDLYLEAAHYADRMIGKLWNWIQSDPQYKDKTTLIITCDHGRGHHNDEAWRSHGSKMPDSDQIWIAIMGPDTPALGELRDGQYYQNQIAQTIAHLMSVSFEPVHKTGSALMPALSSKTK